ncbi:tetratricopeptide repeat protein, partial [Nocardia sp. NPDC004722]
RLYQESLEMAQRIGDRYGEGWSLWGLAILDRRQGDYTLAWARLERAYAIAAELRDTWMRIDTIRGFGHIHLNRDEFASAHRCYTDSLTLAEQTDDPHGQADAWRALARLAALTGDTEHARECLSKAVALYEPMDAVLFHEVRRELDALGE